MASHRRNSSAGGVVSAQQLRSFVLCKPSWVPHLLLKKIKHVENWYLQLVPSITNIFTQPLQTWNAYMNCYDDMAYCCEKTLGLPWCISHDVLFYLAWIPNIVHVGFSFTHTEIFEWIKRNINTEVTTVWRTRWISWTVCISLLQEPVMTKKMC